MGVVYGRVESVGRVDDSNGEEIESPREVVAGLNRTGDAQWIDSLRDERDSRVAGAVAVSVL